MEKKKSVGIQLLGKNKSGELVALLQVRAQWNDEKNSPEFYPGVCQVTVHGKLEEGEDFLQALMREVKEELSEEIVPAIEKLFNAGKLVELVKKSTAEKEIITYGAIVEQDVLEILLSREKSRSFGGFKVIKKSEIDKIIDLQNINKETGVTDPNIIAMFSDEKEAVRLAFSKLK